MAVSLNSVLGFNSTANCKNFLKNGYLISPIKCTKGRLSVALQVANGDRVATNISDKNMSDSQESKSEISSSVKDPIESESDTKPNEKKTSLKRSSLTAREKLRAARVLSRYTETKPSTASSPKLGSKLVEALKESDKGKKRPGLPEAPTNLLDDSKRGMPKKGWTFELPGNSDVLLIIFSVVFISTVMFSTTYLVWKVGAIHFNDN